MADEFTSIPVLEYSDAISPTSKPSFLCALRHALVNVGFFYLWNPPIGSEVREKLVERSASFFNLPTAEKQQVALSNSKHFRGYASLGIERTGTKKDGRETFTVGFDSPVRGSNLPCYHNLIGPNQWPPESTAPGFRQAVEGYLNEVQALSDTFAILIAEALDIEPTVFTRLLEKTRYSLIRVAAYPQPEISGKNDTGSQGVGPHKDGSFLTFLLQGTGHGGLEVQNKAGDWIAAPPIANTLVVNIGRSLETLTQGLCVATTHRVTLRPSQYCQDHTDTSPGTRLSFPFFQSLGLDVSREDMQVELPDHILSLRRNDDISEVEAYFAEAFKGPVGEALLANGVSSYPEVGIRWYPERQAEVLKQQHASKELDKSQITDKV